ncbi:MAG: hypothetical protein NZ528_14470 [Caldilineales bacterium]|nr:hypothetical protein [Caldilineales bacterium]MDW8318389.1 hypothetical protein [Anaerolineae bacterium]
MTSIRPNAPLGSHKRPSADQPLELTWLVDLLREVLVPVRPDPAFRARLHQELVAAAHQQQAVEEGRARRRLTSPWALLAAGIASAVSVAVGIITYILWHRARTAAG